MKNENVKIPFLPGMVFEDPEKRNFRKNQTFKIEQGIMVENVQKIKTKTKEELFREY